MSFNMIDLNVLKVVTSNKVKALEFAYAFDDTMFSDDMRRGAKLVIDYIKSFRTVPTKRTLIDRYGHRSDDVEKIEELWDELETHSYDENEYEYDLEKMKDRFSLETAKAIRDGIDESINEGDDDDVDADPVDPDAIIKQVKLKIQQVSSVREGRSHTQKVVGEYLSEFKDRYEARAMYPEENPRIMTGYSLIDGVTGGLTWAELLMIGGESGAGKALAVNTPIPTPDGWKTMGEIKVGDRVFGDDGKPCNVIATSGVMYEHECFELTFSDGIKVVADAGHQWLTMTYADRRAKLKRTDKYRKARRKNRKSKGKGLRPYVSDRNRLHPTKSLPEPKPSAVTSADIASSLRVVSRQDAPINHSIHFTKPIKYPKAELPIDPYILGIWLGDGTSRYGEVTTADDFIVQEIVRLGYSVTKETAKYRWWIKNLQGKLRKLNLLQNKHIPNQYLRASKSQRLSLIQGLMDSDGTVDSSCAFTTTSKELCDGMLELLRSIGCSPSCREGVAKLHGKDCGIKYDISFTSKEPVFRLERKLNKQKRNVRFNHRFILDCKPVESVPVQCIQVDSANSCFLCSEGMIPTHNSMLLNNLARQMWMQKNNLYTDPASFTPGYNVLYFSLEMPYEDCFIRFLASLADVPQRDLEQSTLDEEQKRKVDKAYEFIENYEKAGYYFGIVDVPRNVTIEEIELRYTDALLRYRPEVVVVDYLGLMNNRSKDQDWLKIASIAASLHEFARAYNVIILTAHQLTDIKRSSQSKSQEDHKRVGMHRWGRSSLIMHHVNLGIQIETRQGEENYPDLKYHIIKNRRGPMGQGNLIKNFSNAILFDVPSYDDTDPGDISNDIEKLIESVRGREDEDE